MTLNSPGEEQDEYKPEYEYIEGVESLERYRPGGYHPITLGDELCQGRYQVVHKLGYGGTSTTWLAEDRNSRRLVAIKITTAESAHISQEVGFLSRFAGEGFIRQLLNTFSLDGPNGRHSCLVLEAASCSLHAAKDLSYHRLLHLPIARAVIAELVLAVRYLHLQGVAHGGNVARERETEHRFQLQLLIVGLQHLDLHCGNILLRLPDHFQQADPAQLYNITGQPIQLPVVRLDGAPLPPGVPRMVVGPARTGTPSDKISPAHLPVMISDFGEALEPAITIRRHAHTLPPLTPPESFFPDNRTDISMSFPGDIWTLACTMWEILGDRSIFDPWDASRDEILLDQVEVLGKLPDRWWSAWDTRDRCFDEEGLTNVQENRHLRGSGTIAALEERYDWCISEPRKRMKMDSPEKGEKEAFLAMVKAMLVYRPAERATIQEVIDSEWMQKWALPGRVGMDEVGGTGTGLK